MTYTNRKILEGLWMCSQLIRRQVLHRCIEKAIALEWKAIAFRVEYLVPCLVVTRQRSCFGKTTAYSEKWATIY